MTGNLIELAVAVLLAGAVGSVVNGFVNLIMMPIIGYFSGGQDFSEYKVILVDAVVAADGAVTTPENAIMYGAWVNTIISLIIVGLILFIIVKAYNQTKKPVKKAPAAPAGPTQVELLTEILDTLKSQK